MKTYLFELTNDGTQKVEEITEQHFYYKVYNDFLEKFHFTGIEENEDFIPYIVVNNKVLIVLRTDENVEDIEFDVFDCLKDYLCKMA